LKKLITQQTKEINMKNIFFNLLILSSNLTYSADIKINVKNDEKSMNGHLQTFEQENDFLNDTTPDETFNPHGWKVLKGLAGLWLGTEFFFLGGQGIIVLLILPDHIWSGMISSSRVAALSPAKKILTNRFFWISLSSTLTVFSLWILKKSATNLYQGLCAENTIENCM
jgi:hypothetical protein